MKEKDNLKIKEDYLEKIKLLIEKELTLEALWIIENKKGVVEQHFSKGFYKNLSEN